MANEEIKNKIQKLVDKYESLKRAGKIKSYNEAQTRNEFIEPLFEFLGWDMRNSERESEVTTEENVSGDRVDLAFRITGIPKFYLEAKSLKTDLDIEKYALQAINYSWNKGVSWAVLTDFESIKVFNAQTNSTSLFDKLVFEIHYNEFDSDFERLWLLSRESFLINGLDIYAEKYGKKQKSLTVNDKLFDDLKIARAKLTESFRAYNKEKNISDEDLDEGVQRVLDRLIFIRVLEDRELEPPILKALVREFDDNSQKQIFHSLVKKFRELDDIYDSNLFQPHACERWEEYGGAIRDVINMLYGSSTNAYNFKEIPADILGGVYENYLGYIAQKKSHELLRTKNKRKEQGIYYTPRYIVDYIVKNTVVEKLKEIQTVGDLKKLRILDPACGSGSFLTAAFEAVKDKYRDFGSQGGLYTNSTILLENIYGVDLDSQAVEIAKLNLLIDALDEKAKLPNLTENIRVGNSLIDDPKIAGDKAFDWNEEFPEIMKSGGFDIIIGNPPYVFTRGGNFSAEEKSYFERFESGKLNLFALFILKSLELMPQGAFLGFIIPNNILRTTSYDNVRKYILENCKILTIVDLSSNIFKSVTASSVILILKKEIGKKLRDENEVQIISNVADLANNKYQKHLMKQKYYLGNPSFAYNILVDDASMNINKKIAGNSKELGNFCDYILEGIVASKNDITDKKLSDMYKPFIVGKDVGRYSINYKNKWICYDRKKLHRARPEKVFLAQKILIQRIGGGVSPLTATLDKDHYYTFASVNNVVLKDSTSYNFILALLNSKLINWYYSNNFSNKSELTVNISKTFLEKLPIKNIDLSKSQEKNRHDELASLADRMLELHKELQAIQKNTDRWDQINSEIQKTDQFIDQKVYELYGLNKKEIEIIEGEK